MGEVKLITLNLLEGNMFFTPRKILLVLDLIARGYYVIPLGSLRELIYLMYFISV